MVNWIDIVVIMAFLAIIGVGFLSGISRVLSAMLAIYFGAVFAAAFYGTVTDHALRYFSGMSRSTGQLFFFIVLFSISSSIFTIVMSKWLGDVKLPRRLEIIDNAGGAAIGVVVSGLAVTLATMLVSIMLQAVNQAVSGAGQDALLGWARNEFNHSNLVPVFLKMAPFFIQLISPWFPNGLPPLLDTVTPV